MESGPERLREERPQPPRQRAEPDHARVEGEPVPHGPSALNPRAALLLQGRAGNRAVSRLVAQRTAAKAKPKAAPKPAAPTPASVPATAAAAPAHSPQGTVDAASEVAPVQRLADGRPYASPKQDPKFNALTRDVKTKKNLLAKHPPAKSEAENAAKAAKPPQDDKEAQGKAANSEKMNNAKPGGFDKAAFVKAVNDAIAKKAPKNLDEADKFAGSGKADDVKNEVKGKVADGKKDSASAIETTTKAPPDTAAAKDKPVTPLTPDKPPGTPAAPDPASAVPDKAPAAATDFSAGPKSVNDEMAGAEVTEEQLAKSNEPEFTGALKDKKAGEDHAATAPGVVRGKENEVLTKAKADAKQTGTTALNAMSATRNKTGKDLDSGKNKAQSSDEQKRAQVNAKLQTVFDATKTDVENILTGLDKKVDDKFTADEKNARDNFTADHKRRMDAYKDKRYSGWTGGLKWAKDKLMGMPEEANQIFTVARQGYVTAMQGVIGGVADLIAQELKAAKDRIAKGRTDLKAAVDSLSPELKQIGQQAAGEFAGKFDELNENVDNKGNELVDTLATKYTDALKAVDDEIAEEKEKNKGLVDKAIDAVKGVIQTILELKNLLLNVLAKAVSAIGAIIKDPIGFLGNLISAVGGGLKSFMANIGTHLKKGLVSWLLGAAAKAGLELPEKFDLKGILGMLASLLGLTWGAIKGRIISKGVPPEAMAAAETSVPMVQKLAGGGGLKGLWEDIKEKIGDLKETLLSKISEFLIPTVLMAGITWIISLLNPASAFVKACKAIIDIVTFIVQRGAQIAEFVNAILDSVIAIAKGGSGGVGALIENALAKSIPVLIGFLAALLGVGGIAEKVKKIFQAMSKPVMKVVDWVVGKIVGIAKKIWAKMKGLGTKLKDKVRGGDDSPAGKQKRLDKAVAAAESAVSRFKGKFVGRAVLTPILAGIKARYGLTALNVVREGDVWAVEAEINPRKKWVTTIKVNNKEYEISERELARGECEKCEQGKKCTTCEKAKPGEKCKKCAADGKDEVWPADVKAALVAATEAGVKDFLANGFSPGQLTKLVEYKNDAIAAKKRGEKDGPYWGKFWQAFYRWRGDCIHRAFKKVAENNPVLQGKVQLFSTAVKEPDIQSPVGNMTGKWWADVTTDGEWSAHYSKYNAEFGRNALGILYKIKSTKHKP